MPDSTPHAEQQPGTAAPAAAAVAPSHQPETITRHNPRPTPGLGQIEPHLPGIDVRGMASDAQALAAHVSSGAALPEGLTFVKPDRGQGYDLGPTRGIVIVLDDLTQEPTAAEAAAARKFLERDIAWGPDAPTSEGDPNRGGVRFSESLLQQLEQHPEQIEWVQRALHGASQRNGLGAGLQLDPEAAKAAADTLRDSQLQAGAHSHQHRYETAEQQTGQTAGERVSKAWHRQFTGLQPDPAYAKLAQGNLERQRAGFELASWRDPEMLAAITRGEQMRQFFERFRQNRSQYLPNPTPEQLHNRLHPTPELLAAFKIEPISTGDAALDFEQWQEYLLKMTCELYGITPEQLLAEPTPHRLPADFYGPPTFQRPKLLTATGTRPDYLGAKDYSAEIPQWHGLLNYPHSQADRYAAHNRGARNLEAEAAEYLCDDLLLLSQARQQTATFETRQGEEGQERTAIPCHYFCHVLQDEPSPEDIAAFCELLNQYDAEGLFCGGILSPVATVPLVSLPGRQSALVFFAGSACDLETLQADTNGLARGFEELPADVQTYALALLTSADQPYDLARYPHVYPNRGHLAARALWSHQLRLKAYPDGHQPERERYEQYVQQHPAPVYEPIEGNHSDPCSTSHLLAAHGFGRAYPNLWERYTEYNETLSVHWLPSTGQWLLARNGLNYEETLPPFYAASNADLEVHLVSQRLSTQATWPL